MEVRYSYRDAPTIKSFSRSDKFIRGLMGPFGSGKSSGCVVEIIKRGMAQAPGPDGVRRTRWVVVRNTYQQLRDTTIATFLQWLPDRVFGDYNKTEHRYLITAFEGAEIEVLFRALDRPDQVGNLLSLEVTGAWINEAREIPWTIIQAIQGRVGRYPAKKDGGATWFGIVMDTNPPDTDSWWYKVFEEKRPENAALFRQPSGLSPEAENVKNLPARYYENLASGTADKEWIKVYVEGDYGFVIDGKPVYPEYNDGFHCTDKILSLEKAPIYRGWDFGLTPACVFSQLTPSGQWIVFDEMTAESLGVDRFSDDVLMHSSQYYAGRQFIDVGDPAGSQRSQTDEKTCFQILRGKGIDIEPGEQTLTARLEAVKFALNRVVGGRPGIAIHPRCKQLRKGFQGGYQFRRMQTAAERYTDVPDKNAYSHPHDALQYVGTRLFGEALKWRNAKDDDDFVIARDDGRSEVGGY
jgi:hypothetical protein